MTAYSTGDWRIEATYRDEIDSWPQHERWKGHLTLPVSTFFHAWTRRYETLVYMLSPNTITDPTTGRFHSRAGNVQEETDLINDDLTVWNPDVRDLPNFRAQSLLHTAVSPPNRIVESSCMADYSKGRT